MSLDDVLPDQGHLKRYLVWYTVEVEAVTPEVAAGDSTVELALGNYQFQRVEEITPGRELDRRQP